MWWKDSHLKTVENIQEILTLTLTNTATHDTGKTCFFFSIYKTIKTQSNTMIFCQRIYFTEGDALVSVNRWWKHDWTLVHSSLQKGQCNYFPPITINNNNVDKWLLNTFFFLSFFLFLHVVAKQYHRHSLCKVTVPKSIGKK